MGLFSGSYPYTVDSKGRIKFKKFLKRMSPDGKETSNYHLLKQELKVDGKSYRFFYLFNESNWMKFYQEKGLSKLPTIRRTKFLKEQCGEASKDSAERLTFPKQFLEFINSPKELMLQGDGEKIQVWSKSDYESCFDSGLEDSEDTSLWDLG
ncbi:MAG: hypothetical protein CR982_09345 [Candidatus Cloacimonadota bacterium]|nr:MAG: hypothetical protein CR982_09345 [Candidatus Cloacimonadota bacterium]PIE77513.1 MAG: hypothetical protein CSA15_12635 [Candidatus Delongbacteria bacterium]